MFVLFVRYPWSALKIGDEPVRMIESEATGFLPVFETFAAAERFRGASLYRDAEIVVCDPQQAAARGAGEAEGE